MPYPLKLYNASRNWSIGRVAASNLQSVRTATVPPCRICPPLLEVRHAAGANDEAEQSEEGDDDSKTVYDGYRSSAEEYGHVSRTIRPTF
jgi:hypothetical protein